MFRTAFLLICLGLSSCTSSDKEPIQETDHSEKRIMVDDFQLMLDSAKLKGTILLYDLNENTFYSNDFDKAAKGQLPASTYKIPNSIIALELGIVENDSTIIKWDGEPRNREIWEADLYFQPSTRKNRGRRIFA